MPEAMGKYAPYAIVFLVIVLNFLVIDNIIPSLVFFGVAGVFFYLVRKYHDKPWVQRILKVF